jgi:hypothetical protein
MLINKRRIRNLEANLPVVQQGNTIVFAIPLIDEFAGTLAQLGFTDNLNTGETVLPAPQGPVSQYNAEGKYIKHKDQPKETAYRQMEWTWIEWHGPDQVEQWDIVDVPYERYPRTFLPPPSVELSIVTNAQRQRLVVSPPYEYGADNEIMIHVVNLFLELFGQCHVLTEDLNEIIPAEVRRLNWRILPPGQRPWGELRNQLEEVIKQQPRGNQPVIMKRLETINNYRPEFVAVGQAGFNGYLIFGFPAHKLYVLESTQVNNATYVFAEDWEALSKKTKVEILNHDLQEDRIIHRKTWFYRVRTLLGDLE